MRKFQMRMAEIQLGEVTNRPIKDGSGNQIGEKVFIDLLYLGGFVRVEVDKKYSEELKLNSVGTATIEMEPVMEAKSFKTKSGSDFAIVDSGFQNFKLTGFEVDKK